MLPRRARGSNKKRWVTAFPLSSGAHGDTRHDQAPTPTASPRPHPPVSQADHCRSRSVRRSAVTPSTVSPHALFPCIPYHVEAMVRFCTDMSSL